MPEPQEAHIRPYETKDNKLVHFLIGKANFGVLAIANNRAYTHPIILAIWVALSSIFVQYMNWWPKHQSRWVEYVRLLPAFTSMAVAVMFLIDWINRPYFEDLAQEVLKAPDLRNISAHYSRDLGSGFWLFEHEDQVIGLIAVDASNKPDDDDKSSAGKSKGITANIRHFYVVEPYRVANVQEDLLEHAVKHAFSDPKVQRIEASDSPLVPYLRACLRNAGFQLDHNTKKIGILRWNLGVRYLSRDEWKGE